MGQFGVAAQFGGSSPSLCSAKHAHQQQQSRSLHTRSRVNRYFVKRVQYPWIDDMKKEAWKFQHQDMIEHFKENKPSAIDSTAHLAARSWPRFASQDHIRDAKKIPAL